MTQEHRKGAGDMNGLTTLPDAEVQAIGRTAAKIRDLIDRQRKTTVETTVKIGEHLADVRERLANHGNGTFNNWVAKEFGMVPKMAYRAINVWGLLKDCDTLSQTLDVSAAYLISEKACPDPARKEVLRLAETGHLVTHAKAKEIVDRHSGKAADRLPAGYSPHGTGKKAPKAKNGASCFTDVTQEKRSEAAASVALDGDTAPLDPPDPQPWPGDGEPDEQDAPAFAAPVVIEATAKTVPDVDPDLVFRDGLLPPFSAWTSRSKSLVKPAVTKCISDALEMLSTGEPIE